MGSSKSRPRTFEHRRSRQIDEQIRKSKLYYRCIQRLLLLEIIPNKGVSPKQMNVFYKKHEVQLKKSLRKDSPDVRQKHRSVANGVRSRSCAAALLVKTPVIDVIETKFDHKCYCGYTLRDVGSQKVSRKWLHMLDDRGVVAAGLFVDLASYDKTSYLRDCFKLFSIITSSPHYNSKSSVILFFSNKDVFAEKIKKIPLRSMYPQGSCSLTKDANFTDSVNFLMDRFEELSNKKRTHRLFMNPEDLQTDPNLRHVLDRITDIVQTNCLLQYDMI